MNKQNSGFILPLKRRAIPLSALAAAACLSVSGFVLPNLSAADETKAVASSTGNTTDAPIPVADAAANADWQAYEDALKLRPSKSAKELTHQELYQFIEDRAQAIRQKGLAFIEKHPADPRRWNVIVQFNAASPRFVKEWGPEDEKGVPKTTVDEAAASAWKAKVEELRAGLATATDVPADVRELLAAQEAIKPFQDALQAANQHQPVDTAALREKLTAFLEKSPTSKQGPALLNYYIWVLEKVQPEKVKAEYQAFASSPNQPVREAATAKAHFYELISKPLDLAFTALDGRKVDLAELRGKIVLVDFWATWCGPCVAELPNVKKAYAAYHDKGFEIVGISLDQAADRQKLIDFTVKEGLAWPQYFDGKGWKNDVSTRFAITSIPSTLLLDRTGQVVVTNARGEKLDSEIKRLLAN